jgi:hypothetical protein
MASKASPPTSSSSGRDSESFSDSGSDDRNDIEMDNLEDVVVTPAFPSNSERAIYKQEHRADSPDDDDDDEGDLDHEDERALLGRASHAHPTSNRKDGASSKPGIWKQVKHLVIEVRRE